jgi:hypothetical protein
MERKLSLIMNEEEKKETQKEMIERQFDSPAFNLNPKPKRARDKDGKFIPDDPETPDYNEAWVGGKAPENK